MVEHFDMAFGFHVERFLHAGLPHQHRYVAVQDIHFLVGVCHHAPCRPDAGDADKDAAQQETAAENGHQLDFVF